MRWLNGLSMYSAHEFQTASAWKTYVGVKWKEILVNPWHAKKKLILLGINVSIGPKQCHLMLKYYLNIPYHPAISLSSSNSKWYEKIAWFLQLFGEIFSEQCDVFINFPERIIMFSRYCANVLCHVFSNSQQKTDVLKLAVNSLWIDVDAVYNLQSL